MADLTQEIVIEAIMNALPYPSHVSRINLSDPRAVRFHWRNEQFKVEFSGVSVSVWAVKDGMLHTNSTTILAEAVLQRWLNHSDWEKRTTEETING